MKLRQINETFTTSIGAGLWISPDGKILKVDVNHVTDLINNAQTFGFTREYIESVYKKHNEPLYSEGDAREVLINEALTRGWIRVRNYKNYWSVTVHKLTDRLKKILRDWVNTFVKSKLMSKYDEIRILEVLSDNLKSVEADDILAYALEESVEVLSVSTYSQM